jgi:hypothetical protein
VADQEYFLKNNFSEWEVVEEGRMEIFAKVVEVVITEEVKGITKYMHPPFPEL